MKRFIKYNNKSQRASCFALVWALFTLLYELPVNATFWPQPKTPQANCRTASSDAQAFVIPCVLGRIYLEDVSYYVRGNWRPNTFVRFSPDARLLAIGSYTGRMRMWDIYAKKMLWEEKIAEGTVRRIDFSPDGRVVYFGEQSVDGFIYAVDSRTGEVIWRFRLADDLETSRPPAKDDTQGIYKLPGPYALKTLDNGDIVVLGQHAWGGDFLVDDLKRLSRVYRLSPEGRIRWAYPERAPLPNTIIHMDVDNKGSRVAFLVTYKGGQRSVPHPFEEGTIVVLDARNGKHLFHHTFKPLRPFFDRVGFWESVSISPSGERASVGLFDGRTFLFDLKKLRIQKTFSFGSPILISNVPVSASASYNHLAPDDMAYFQTGVSSVPYASTMQHVVTPPGPHPNATTMTAVHPNGRVAWRYRSGHRFQNFWTSSDGRFLLTSVSRDDERLGREAGAFLFDTHRPGGGTAKLVYFYQVAGMTHFHADLARDGSAFALVETPYRDPKSNKIVGDYSVHIVR